MRAIRVLESFGRPKPTTNPYITQLSVALRSDPGLIVENFTWRAALTGTYDVFHVHWPDALLAGRTPLTRWGKRAAAAVLVARLSLLRIPVVRTMHNATPHEHARFASWFDRALSDRTRVRIHLNDVGDRNSRDITIAHGDYRQWFSEYPRREGIAGRVGFAGLIRPYKGVEDLIRTFRELAEHNDDVSLRIVGMPRSDEARRSIDDEVRRTPRTTVKFAYVSDRDLVAALTECQLVALPYRQMTNSGAALAALSLDRPVLLPRTPVTESLQREVGQAWVTLFDAPLTAKSLATALTSAASLPPSSRVSFSSRDWTEAGPRHRVAFERALESPRRTRMSGPSAIKNSEHCMTPTRSFDAQHPLKLRIAIPTYKRAELLARILTEVTSQVAEMQSARPDVALTVQVIDNDPDGSGHSACEGRDVSYVVEPAPGIAAVRNRSLAEASDQDALIYIDDDEIPAAGWLDALVSRFLESDADAVAGKVITPFPAGVDEWLRVSGAFIRPKRADGQFINEAATNNLLLDLHSVRSLGLTFDERFGLTGGSDSLFTRQFTAHGARIVWAENALVMEQEDPTRLTREWVLRRTFRLGNTKTRVNVILAKSPLTRGFARCRMMLHGIARVTSGWLLIGWGRTVGSLAHRGRGERRAARGRGMLAGVFGYAHNEYGLRRAAETQNDSGSKSTAARPGKNPRTAGRGAMKDLVMRAGSGAFRVLGSITASQRPMPDFLVVGTKRGGTTSFYYDLLKVPQIIPMFPSSRFLPKANETKGVHFFDTHYHKGLRWYRSYMPTRRARARAEKRLGSRVMVGEASPYYLFHPLAAARAYAAVPNAKIILLLRDPVQRTYSHWKERRRGDAEPLSFEESLEAETERLRGEEERLIADPRYYSYAHEQQSYVAQSHYARSLKRWADLYGMQNILVVASEEYYADQPATIAKVARFLGLAGDSVPAGERMNAAAGDPLPAHFHAKLAAEFAEDNDELQRMIGRTLPWS